MAQNPSLLPDWYPPTQFNVVEEKDREGAVSLSRSMSSTSWGNGPLQGTEYYRLAQCSPEHAGDKQLVIVCKRDLLEPVTA